MDPVLIVSLMSLGCFVGLAAGLLGVGGGMILVPFLIMLLPMYGLPEPLVVHAAIATGMATIIFTSMSSMRAHHAKKAIRWDIVAVLAPGMVAGGLLSGGAAFSYLSGAWLSLFFALFVGYSGAKMLWGKPPAVSREMPGKTVTVLVGVAIGFASGLLGAGGAFLSVPFMMRGNVSVRSAVASSAALGFFIAVANSAGYIFSGFDQVHGQSGMLGYIYWPALLVLSSMSMLLAPVGARYTHRLPVRTVQRLFAALLFSLAAYMLYSTYKTFWP